MWLPKMYQVGFLIPVALRITTIKKLVVIALKMLKWVVKTDFNYEVRFQVSPVKMSISLMYHALEGKTSFALLLSRGFARSLSLRMARSTFLSSCVHLL